ncbi:DUF2059 domain-containing protein [Wohlfahrtiimonas larvae]|uniref:DUF2059 domain-containing protein n=1 Tax=Wohlfahrtiimonas larvae TaxID=1157986 RepID=A0ABP9N040_9GAMM|nr:DUF2059 domain-containing protein [Wohlfahrtiimonas larvae]
MKKLLLSVCLGSSLIFSSAVFAQTASEQSIKQLIVETGAAEMGTMVFDQLLAQLKAAGATDAQIAEVQKEFKVDQLVDLLVPVYQKQFTEEDVKAFLEFYQSPAGKKLVEKQPMIMQESMVVGQQWGMGVAQKIQEILSK